MSLSKLQPAVPGDSEPASSAFAVSLGRWWTSPKYWWA